MGPPGGQNVRIDQGYPTICRLTMVRTYVKVPTAEQAKYTVALDSMVQVEKSTHAVMSESEYPGT